ncbi:MAG TPA: hypothetical protein VLT61_12695, partial [Anaeromyxobacteraceae bacterium]|nr:hypothetical protein [Anaeromyxobacteraceae bacterium]
MGRRWWLWPALVVTATLAPFWRVIAGAVTLVSRDTFELYEPMRALIVPALRAGRLPLWNPYEAAGVPLFAQALHGVLHPVSIVTALPPFEGLDAAVVLYVVAAAMGAYALARTLGATPAASACAAFGYGLGGYTVSMAANIVFLAGAASAPWTLAAMRRCAAPGSAPRHVVGVAVAVAVTAFSGEFESLAWSLALGSVLAADAGGRRGLARSVVGAGLGILVAGVQLVPSWVFLQRTTRGDALDVAERLQWPLEPWRLVEWIAPGFFWSVDASPFLLLGGETQHAVPFAESVFIGGAVLVLALGGVGRSRTARLLVMFAGLCLWQALGYRLGAAQLTSFVPIWGEFRYAEKLMAPITLCAAVLCALGADRVTTAGPPRWLERAAMGLLVAVAMAGVVSWLAPGAVRAFFLAAGRGQGPTPPPPEFVAAAASSRDHLARGVLRAVPFLAALVLLLRTVRVHRAAWALPALAWVV